MKQQAWPIYYKDILFLGKVESNIGICTLWTPKDSLCSSLNKKSFSICGQLYSKRGINFILRNILAKPIINTIILCGTDRSGSGETLLKLIKEGVGDNYQVIGDKNCEIHLEIDRESLEQFRKNITIIDKRGTTDPQKIQKIIDRVKLKKSFWAKPKKFTENVFSGGEKYPSEKSTFPIRASFIWEAWVQMLRLVMKLGSKKGMIKIGEVKELVNLIATIEDEDPYSPELHEVFNFTARDLDIYYKDFFNPSKGSESYNYGERLFLYPQGLPLYEFNAKVNNTKRNFKLQNKITTIRGLNQLEEIYEKYCRYHEDRGMLALLWNPWIDNVKEGWMGNKTKNSEFKSQGGAGNVPCMVLLQFTYRSKKLHLTAYFRSNDIFDAWPRNTFALRKLQFDFAKRIGKKPGYLTTISNCAQVYENNYEQALKIINQYKDSPFCMPDKRSTVIIEVKGEDIIVSHMSPSGDEQLDEFRLKGDTFKAASKMMDILVAHNVFSSVLHSADIAIELSKAEWSVKNHKHYIQDRDWKELV
jgi:thymidylate synthase